jgi:hypothetical protein
MDNIKNIKKQWMSSLVFLDNCVVNCIIVVVLLLYSSTIFENINMFVGNLYKFSIVKLVVLLLIIYVAPKDTAIAILLAISYLVSLKYSIYEDFTSSNNVVPVDWSLNKSQNVNSDTNLSSYASVDGSSNNGNNVESFQGFPFLEHNEKVHEKNTSNCMKNYVPKNQEINNVCEPVSTFENSYNTQGLNDPEGFNGLNNGSPLD